MFTGLVQQVGTLEGLAKSGGGWSARVRCEPWKDALVIGESVAVQGACLTVTTENGDGFDADVLDETYRLTALRAMTPSAKVNLERALAVGDRLGGHWVAGHVDECGRLSRVTPAGRDFVWRVSCSKTFARQTVMKGSVAMDGVSLTVSGLGDDWFEVNLIPHTLASTSLCERHIGDEVDLESDILGKYVARLLGKDAPDGVTEKLLAENGFMGNQ